MQKVLLDFVPGIFFFNDLKNNNIIIPLDNFLFFPRGGSEHLARNQISLNFSVKLSVIFYNY